MKNQRFTIEKRQTTLTDFSVDASNIEEAFKLVRAGKAVSIRSRTSEELVINETVEEFKAEKKGRK